MSREPLPLLGNGVYSFSEAARYTGLRQSRIREWFRDKTDGGTLFASDYGGSTEQKLISFHDLIEAFMHYDQSRTLIRLKAKFLAAKAIR